MQKLKVVALTVSDTCSKDPSADKSGPLLKQLIADAFPLSEISGEIVPDDQIKIVECLRKHTACQVHAIFTTGGTGFAPRDVTPEATKAVITKECPQLSLVMTLKSLEKTPFAALSRAICGIADKTLIINFPGSTKAVQECFDSIKTLLPHVFNLLDDNHKEVKATHDSVQLDNHPAHVCPHKTGTGKPEEDRNSPYPMLNVELALELILQNVLKHQSSAAKLQFNQISPINLPPFRASIKDGYALKSSGLSGTKQVVGYIAAGDPINRRVLNEDECFKINTGAAIPQDCDSIIQVEDTTLLKRNSKTGHEELVQVLVDPKKNLDVRPIGCDLKYGEKIFPSVDASNVVRKSILASIGKCFNDERPTIGIISTGSELIEPTLGQFSIPNPEEGKIYDSNSTMLQELCLKFGVPWKKSVIVKDDFDSVKAAITEIVNDTDFIICTGGVSMGDKDLIKPVLESLGFQIQFGRVNMKPGKPTTYATNDKKHFFGLPGNPVSAFVTFHLFVLPALRAALGYEKNKWHLAKILVKLENDRLPLDPRPEYVRASVVSRQGELLAKVTGDQISSRLQSIVGADVLLQLPGRTNHKHFVEAGENLQALVLRTDFISKYE